ncbi:hypothetical protein BGZ65_008686 [Modicella reniformis]|uniref:ATP synthase subunit H, mitochondrial n=1 Tax=Modicella reniformis TaxID=1440133 RepID=A0A9P6JGH1_9FUNG|nr:hypothetical protein BGZ65_008686 [Modicella reniformis]
MALRSFNAPSAPLMQDVVKDLYLKELKGYKPTPDTKDADASSQVKDFKPLPTPTAPVVDAAADLAAWENANVEVADVVINNVVEEEQEEDDDDDEKDEHHH